MLSFILSALLNLCLALSYLVLDNQRIARINSIDGSFSGVFGRLNWFTVTQEKRNFWLPVIEKAVLSLSDQQLLTGLAILIAGLWNLCSISVRHFTIVSDLAWFSSNVHITTLGILENYFRQKSRRAYRNWRAVLMFVMATLMIATIIMQGHEDWYTSSSYPAKCLIDDLVGNVSGPSAFWMSFNLVLLLYGYSFTLIFLYNTPSEFIQKWLFTIPAASIGKSIDRQKEGQYRVNSLVRWLYAIHSVLLFMQEIFYSQCLGFVVDIIWFILGIHWIRLDRETPDGVTDTNENELGFGQIVPILLLSSIILTLREAYDGKFMATIQQRYRVILTVLLDEEHKNGDPPVLSTAPTRSSAPVFNQDLPDSLRSRRMPGVINSSDVDHEDSISLHIRRADTEGGGRAATSAVRSQQFVLAPRRTFPP